ncbi:MFS transporter [Fulvivirgaceae bacterium BMA10]|uniref:MFS transporter n=1 Tax=Splendidivirga corallicola TaxID=3051826 RepID=A0ABT8KUA8_9BACT|nr:MFS transporter [Fulvivirgaceae bacterium BMA10]
MKRTKLHKNVYLLGFVSLFTDLSSQMVYPLVPQFLTSLGASSTIIGLVEGIAESTASLFKAVFGKLSDRFGKRKLFVFMGYGLSALSKPFLFLATLWPHVLVVKFSDRVGKAVRNPARDALISTSVPSDIRATAFGWHRAMDRVGAIGGPLLAMLILAFIDEDVRWVFLLSAIPALMALIFIPFAHESEEMFKATATRRDSWEKGRHEYKIFLIVMIIFTLGNSSNAFLILKALESDFSIVTIPVLWMVYNVVCTISSPILGKYADKVGKKHVIYLSFLYYTLIYSVFAFVYEQWMIWLLFAAYGIYYGLSAGVYKAYIADLVPPNNRAGAYGIFETGIGLALFPASLIMGLIWDSFGSQWAFLTSAGFSFLAVLVLMLSSLRNKTSFG